jgi:hypothetical protein
MYSAPVDKVVFQTVIVALICWWIYTFLYKPVVYGPEPLTFTTDEVIRIIQTVMNDFHEEHSRKKYDCIEDKFTNTPDTPRQKKTDDLDAAITLISLKHN